MKDKIKNIGTLIVFAAAIFSVFYLLIISGLFDDIKPNTLQDKLLTIIGILIMVFLVFGFHELGHIIAGSVQGFRFQLFAVGPLGVKREGDKIRVYLNKNPAYYGGISSTSPQNDDADIGKKFGRVLLSGPAASLLFAVFCLFLAYFSAKPFGMIFFAGGNLSIAIFFATTIPSKTGVFFTDRKRYQRLTRPGKDREVELAMLRIMGKFTKNNSYREVDKEDLDKMINDNIPFIQFLGLFNYLCYQYETDKKTDPQTEERYTMLSNQMSKKIVDGMNRELEKFKSAVA